MITQKMPRLPRRLWVPIVLAVTACDLHGGSDPEQGEVTPQVRKKRPMPTLPTEIDAKLQALVDKARDDLITRLEVQKLDAKDIKVLRAERVTWRTSALGCPLPDRGYTMVLTPGVLVLLRAEGGNYEYHSTLMGPPFLCEPAGRIETPAPPGNYSLDPT